jgi:hypothetical protein
MQLGPSQEELHCQTDMISIDFIVTSSGTGVFQPYVIKVKDLASAS